MIRRANLDGTALEEAANFQSSLGNVGIVSLAIDSAASKVYFGDTNTNAIYRSDFDGSVLESLISFSVNVDLEDIEVDSSGGKLYWTDKLTNKLQRANLDGSAIEDLVTGDEPTNAFGRHLALDTTAQKAYWSTPGSPFGEGNPGGIFRVNFDGTNAEQVLVNGDDVNGLDLGPSPSVNPIPEPTTLVIWSVLGGIGFVGSRWRRRRKAA